jgi:alpha-1,2-mannosyltransferase
VAWTRRPDGVGAAALLIGTILISPHETVYDLVLLAPAFLLLAEVNLERAHDPRLWALLGAAYLLAMTGGFVRVTHVQLASPILVTLLYLAVRVSGPTEAAGVELRDFESR